MISSGESMIDVASELKKRGAKRVFCATTFGLFTNGFDKFDEAYEKGIIDKILTTNLVYQPDELLSKPWYINVDMSKYMALLSIHLTMILQSATFLILLIEFRRELRNIMKDMLNNIYICSFIV